MSRAAALGLLAAAAAGLVACGGGDDEPAEDAPPRSAADYRAAADAACTTFARANDALVRDGAPADLAEQERLDAALANAADTQAEALAALAAPPDLQARHKALVANHRENADAYRAAAEAAGQGDAEGQRRAVQARGEVGNEQLRLSRELGLQACARILPADARADVQAVTRRVLLGTDPQRSCDDDVTVAFIASNLSGSRASCRKVLRGLREDGATVDITTTTGVDGVIASANVAFSTARGKAPKPLTYDLVWDNGAWRVNSAFDPSAQLSR